MLDSIPCPAAGTNHLPLQGDPEPLQRAGRAVPAPTAARASREHSPLLRSATASPSLLHALMIKTAVSCPHRKIHPSVTLKLQRARKMLPNLPIAGKTQDLPTNRKGLSYGPCPGLLLKGLLSHTVASLFSLICARTLRRHRGKGLRRQSR